VSYDYLGAYTEAPIVVPPANRAIPRVPVLWDISIDPERMPLLEGQVLPQGAASVYSHVPAGGNVLWLDGHVEFRAGAAWEGMNLPYAPEGIAFQPPSLDRLHEPDPLDPRFEQ
jgi:prepilin-type processing-associated H-X9-DG protein